jgi:hypothetical protein
VRFVVGLIALLGLSLSASASEVSSEYTEFDTETDCVVVSSSGDDEGDWADLVCPGYKGYPVLIFYSDLRESLFYGFPPEFDRVPDFMSFSGFNRIGPTIEWRVAPRGTSSVPFATIHRWFVADAEFPGEDTEVLVVRKVGQPDNRQGCVVGFVVASGNPNANDQARRVADDQARDFACGADQPAVLSGSVPLPDFTYGN